MQIERREIKSVLVKKGFEKRECRKHTYFFHIYRKKESGIKTFTSRGTKFRTYYNPLLNSIKKQLHLDTLFQLKDLVYCPMSEDDYNNILKTKGIL